MKIIPHPTILQVLKCPICQHTMELRQSPLPSGSTSLLCNGPKRHCYDFSSGGYVNLMPPGHANGGDSKEAVRARTAFLNTRLYQPIAEALCELLTEYSVKAGDLVIDAGCGEGYYSLQLAKKGFSVLGADLSKFAVDTAAKRAAREHAERTMFTVSSVFALPVADASASAVVNVFAPCVEAEYSRVLREGGILAMVYAGPEHLMGLKRVLYAQTKENEQRQDFPEHMPTIAKRRIRFSISLKDNEAIRNLFAMTPYYWRTSPQDSQKLQGLEQLDTVVDVMIAICRKSG